MSNLPDGLEHKDFTDETDRQPLAGAAPEAANAIQAWPLRDRYGHGTHVAGIIGGALKGKAKALSFFRDDANRSTELTDTIEEIRGVAPECKLISYKVLDDVGRGDVRNVIAALEDIARTNGDGRDIRIHGVNLSLGYPFDPRWFACGQSPVCEVVNRLVSSGVVVVAAAGNTGYAYFDTVMGGGTWAQGVALSINDPGNADRAITVGSTHRDAPHRYGASYFSSKGPTGDGRPKPDLLAPGEKIISCNSGVRAANVGAEPAEYREDSGTSMAAPHVSGAVAAFLSIRREFIGRADVVKEIFMKSAIDLKRQRDLQGCGLVDLLRALQSV